MKSSIPSSPAPTSERLLEAAGRVFARTGIKAATTRELAKEAGVNEVTLFRIFQNKAGLLAAVLERAFLTPAEQYPQLSVRDGVSLREVVTAFATVDYEKKRRHIGLMRVLVGEVHALGDLDSEILSRIFKPWKEVLGSRLREAQELGLMRPEANPAIVVDQLTAMIFVGALKADTMRAMDYTPEAYLAACIDTLLTGIEPPAAASSSAGRAMASGKNKTNPANPKPANPKPSRPRP